MLFEIFESDSKSKYIKIKKIKEKISLIGIFLFFKHICEKESLFHQNLISEN